MSQAMLAERVGVSKPTIVKLEDGNPSVSLATLLRVLAALGMGADIDLLAADDTLGRSLQDNALTRAPPGISPPRSARKPPGSAPRTPTS